MRKLVTLVAALVLAWPFAAASKEVPGLTVLKDPDRVAYTAYFTTSTEAGVYYIGTAFPTAVLDFEFGSDFSAILYACDTQDGAGDNDLSDDVECVALATLATADSTVDPLKAKKLWYVLDINTAGTATLTIKGSWQQVSGGGFSTIGGEDTLEYIFQLDEFSADSLAFEGGAKDFFFSQGSGGLLPAGADSNTGTAASPYRTCAKMEAIINAVPGARIWVDGADGDWTAAGGGEGTDNCDGFLNGIDIDCDPDRGMCAVVSAIDPANPFVIDGSGASSGTDIFQCTSATSGATLGIQNVSVTVPANADAIDTDSYCNAIALNFVCSIPAGNGSDNCFTPHDDVNGTIWVLGDGSSGTITSASTGTNFVAASGAGTSHLGFITRGTFANNDDVASQAVVIQSGGADGSVYMIGPRLVDGSSTQATFVLLDSLSGSGNTHRWKVARTTLVGAQATTQLYRAVANAADEHTYWNGWQNSWVGNGIAFQIITQGQEADSTFKFIEQDALVDGMGGSITNHDGTGDAGTFVFNLQGVFDEDDDANSWDIDSTLYSTLVLAQAGYPSGWSIGTDSTYADLGGAGTECGHNEDNCASATLTLPVGYCHENRACYTQGVEGTYYLSMDTPFGLPYIIPGVTLRGFQLNRGNMGAR